jgi:hypothetical protein
MTDLIARLSRQYDDEGNIHPLAKEAIARIEQLQRELAALASERQKQAQQVISDSWQEMERAKQAEPNLIPVDFDTDDWIESRGENMVTCHSRTVGGVLCRYWGENVPRGRALIDAAAAPQQSAEPAPCANCTNEQQCAAYEAGVKSVLRNAPPAVQAEPVAMSMFATKADYDAALAQQAEPMAWMKGMNVCISIESDAAMLADGYQPLYTAPPAVQDQKQIMCACGDVYPASAFVCDNCRASAAPPAAQAEPTPSSDLEKAVASFGAAMLTLGFCPMERRAEMRAWKDEAYKAVIEAATPADDEAVRLRSELLHSKNCLGVAADQINEAVRLLREARSYVVGDHGWDYDNGGWLADRIEAYLAKHADHR